MLSQFFLSSLYSTLGAASSPAGSGFAALSFPLAAAAQTQAALAAEALAGQIDDEAAKVAAYDQLLAAVTGFQDALSGLDVSDEAAATASAEAVVEAYNGLLGTIGSLTGSGGALEGESAAGQLIAALQNELSASFAATGSFDQLWQIGIAPQADGTLALDADVFAAAWAEDAAGAASLLSEAAAAFDALAEPYAAGGGLIEATANVFADNLLDLQAALPALDYFGGQTQAWADAQYSGAVAQLYGQSLAESVFAAWSAQLFSIEA